MLSLANVLNESSQIVALSLKGTDPWSLDTAFVRNEEMSDYVAAASRVLTWRAMQQTNAARSADANSGQMLVLLYEYGMNDGIASDASEGLFDVCNHPPPLFWVAHVEDELQISTADVVHRFGKHPRYIFAWIPNAYLLHARRGVEANAERCLQWIDDSECAYFRTATAVHERLMKLRRSSA